MKKQIAAIFLLFVVTALFFSPKSLCQTQLDVPSSHQRIISLSPSITEILYALGAGDQVVGVTRFCNFPPEAKDKPKVGGLLDTSFEFIYRLKPDLVLLQKGEMGQKMKLEQMGVKTVETKTKSIESILESIKLIGDLLSKTSEAKAIINRIEKRVSFIETQTQGLKPPRVLITFSRHFGKRTIEQVYIAGQDTFFADLLRVSGGKNAYEGTEFVTSPLVSAEGILRMNPDIIIEIMSSLDDLGLTQEDVLKDWESLNHLDAYKNEKIFIITDSFIGIPGPRIDQSLDAFVRILHSEVDWEGLDD